MRGPSRRPARRSIVHPTVANASARDAERYADPDGRDVAESCGDDGSSEGRPQAVADVQPRVVGGGGKRLGIARDIHETGLNCGTESSAGARHEKQADEEAEGVSARSSREPTRATMNAAKVTKTARSGPRSARRPPTRLPTVIPRPATTSTSGTAGALEPRNLGRQPGNVAVDGEEPTETDRSGGQGDPHGEPRETGEFATKGRGGIARLRGNGERDRHSAQAKIARDPEVGDTPSRSLTEERDEGHPDDVGDGQARRARAPHLGPDCRGP